MCIYFDLVGAVQHVGTRELVVYCKVDRRTKKGEKSAGTWFSIVIFFFVIAGAAVNIVANRRPKRAVAPFHMS